MGYVNGTSTATAPISYEPSLQSITNELDTVGAASIIENEAEPDAYGQVHPMETEDLIQQACIEFDETLDRMPSKKKQSALDAQVKCPELVADSFKLMFLRCECFQTELAVKRYVKYWDKRVEAFGPIYAFQPLTLTGALRDDTVPLELGAMHVIRRNKARDILYFDPSKLDKTKYSRESARRAFWYFCHALLEDADVQKRGMIILNFNRHFSNSNRDPQFTKMCVSTIKGALPIRMSAIHGCHVPYMYSCAIALVMLFLGERLRKRILLHNGTNEHVLTVLEDGYRIAAQHIPTDMGGLLQLNVLAWLEERRADGL